jgi:octaprenyl-diphosphate synthase
MSRSLDDIKAPVAAEISAFEPHFREAMRSKVALLDKIMYYIVQRKGKQMRPMFVFLSAQACGGVKESTYTAASMIELLHTATLVHDDVVDDSNMRRGFFSINALWKNKIAVLVGDYLLSQGLLLALKNKEYPLLDILSTAVREMSEGELLQMERARKMDVDEAIYFEIIRQKTASLIAAACACGAESAGADPETVELMRAFGERAGLAFQIRDDLFDFGDDDAGKPAGIDLKEKKMTLPLIYSMRMAPPAERKKIVKLIRGFADHPETLPEVVSFVKHYGGIDYTRERMQRLRSEALGMLERLPRSDSRVALGELVQFVIDRKL